MRRRADEAEEEREDGLEARGRDGGDLGAMLLGAQEGAGNAALASLMGRIEGGEAPATALLPGHPGDAEDARLDLRAQRGAVDRATHAGLAQRLVKAKVSPFARRIEGELQSFGRRLEDAREYGWLGTDAGVLSSELEELEDKLVRAEA